MAQYIPPPPSNITLSLTLVVRGLMAIVYWSPSTVSLAVAGAFGLGSKEASSFCSSTIPAPFNALTVMVDRFVCRRDT